MKSKLLLLVLSFSIVLFGCKKEKSSEDKLADVKTQIIGTWEVQSSTETFYDASGKVVETVPAKIDDGVQIQFLDSNTFKTSDSPNDSRSYTLTNIDGKVVLDLGNESYELTITNNTMSWSVEAGVNDDTVVKGVTTIHFKKI